MSRGSSGFDLALQQRLNLLGGALANMSAGQACGTPPLHTENKYHSIGLINSLADLMGDFRVGYLLRTPAASQFLGQAIGTLFASLAAPMLFNLFASAYPCIIQHDDVNQISPDSNHTVNNHRCEFSGPSISTWRAVAVAASVGTSSAVPSTSISFAVWFTALGATVALVRNIIRSSLKPYFPNMLIMGLAFTMPSPPYGLAMLGGALGARIWRKKKKASYENYLSSVAAGLIAGEGIGGIINGALMIAIGWGGEGWGTRMVCPGGQC